MTTTILNLHRYTYTRAHNERIADREYRADILTMNICDIESEYYNIMSASTYMDVCAFGSVVNRTCCTRSTGRHDDVVLRKTALSRVLS